MAKVLPTILSRYRRLLEGEHPGRANLGPGRFAGCHEKGSDLPPVHEKQIGKSSKQNYCRFAYQNNDLRSILIKAPLLQQFELFAKIHIRHHNSDVLLPYQAIIMIS